MKHIKLSLSVLFACLIVLLHAGSDEDSQPQNPPFPIGKNVGSVEFDCVIELVAPVTKERNVFFLRYQVSPKEIAYDIHWAEPAWLHVNFPYPPFGLSMYADDSHFIIYSSWNNKRWEHALPEKRPDVFNFTLGNYPIDEKRHYLSESLLARMYVKDIETITVKGYEIDARVIPKSGSPVANSESRRGLRTNNFAFLQLVFYLSNLDFQR